MPHLRVALAAARWRSEPAWKVAAHNIGGKLRPFALLAHEFCPWADRMRVLFHNLVQMAPVDRPPALRHHSSPRFQRASQDGHR